MKTTIAASALPVAPSLPAGQAPVLAGDLPESGRDRVRTVYIAPLVLAGLAMLAFRGGFEHEFTNWDDVHYIVQNPLIQGLSFERIAEAFTSFHLFNYNPLHLVSYMVDHEIWGLDPAGFFLTSLVIHVSAGVLVYFLALHWLRAPWQAFWVGAVFLLHPTRVESVAWLSERKDVLSGAFGAAALLCYSKSLDAPPGAGRGSRAILVVGAFLLFLAALLSKSQLILLPLVLLAMDACRSIPPGRSIAGKIPFFILSAVFAVVTLRAHAGEASLGFGLPDSILDPLAAIPRYLADFLAPIRLGPYHDYSTETFHGLLPVALGICLVLIATIAARASWRGDRRVLLGLVWSLAFIAPVLGFFKIRISFADRYLYLAAVGLAVAAACVIERAGALRRPARVLQAISIPAMVFLTVGYLPVFRDSEALWSRVLESFPDSSLARASLGGHCLGQGRFAEAAAHYDADLAVKPFYETSILGRALLHEESGDRTSARRLYGLALEHRPSSVTARIHYADFLERAGETDAAIEVLQGIEPAARDGSLYRRLSDALRRARRPAEARSAGRRAVELSPHDPRAWLALALAEDDAGNPAGGMAARARALELAPGWKDALEPSSP